MNGNPGEEASREYAEFEKRVAPENVGIAPTTIEDKLQAILDALGEAQAPPPPHVRPLAREIDKMLRIELVEVTPATGHDEVNQDENFTAKFRIIASNDNIDGYVQFRNVKVEFKPGKYARPTGQKLWEFNEVTSSNPREITVDFKAKSKSAAGSVSETGLEHFTKVEVGGNLNPLMLLRSYRKHNFFTEIAGT